MLEYCLIYLSHSHILSFYIFHGGILTHNTKTCLSSLLIFISKLCNSHLFLSSFNFSLTLCNSSWTNSSLTYDCTTNINLWSGDYSYPINFFLINLFLNLVKKLSSSLNNDPKKFTSFDLLRPNLNAIIPNTNNKDNIFNFHFLK